MSSTEQVISNLFSYVSLYLNNNGENCICCCPNSSFTFDVLPNLTDFIIHSWNFNSPQPTLEMLKEINYNDVLNHIKFLKIVSNEQQLKIQQLINLINLSRTRDITLSDIKDFL